MNPTIVRDQIGKGEGRTKATARDSAAKQLFCLIDRPYHDQLERQQNGA